MKNGLVLRCVAVAVQLPAAPTAPAQITHAAELKGIAVIASDQNVDGGASAGVVSFADDIQPIFTASCVVCHSPGGFADLSGIPMDLREGESHSMIVNVASVQRPDLVLVVPGDSGASLLFQKVASDAPPVGGRMPLGGPVLTDHQIELIRDWIDQGALETVGGCSTDADCDDADACTTDNCDPATGTCSNDPISCDDGLFCNGVETCEDGVCQSSGDPCSANETCDEGNDSCLAPPACTSDADCADGNPCTDDSCDPDGACRNVADDTNTCDDEDPCTENDVCSDGDCAGTATSACCDTEEDCDDGNVCSDDTCVDGLCVRKFRSPCCTTDAQCDDNNVCTDDFCQDDVCWSVANALPCDDGIGCTVDDVCFQGACGGTPAVAGCCSRDSHCDDGDDCTTDACEGDLCAHSVIESCEGATDEITGENDGGAEEAPEMREMPSACGAFGLVSALALFGGLVVLGLTKKRPTGGQ